MSISFRFMVLFIALSIISIKLRAKTGCSVPVIRIAEHMSEDMMKELVFYAKALGINDATTIQVRYSLRLTGLKNGLIQYEKTGFGKEQHQVMIWINRRLTSSEQSMTLAHEMVHAAQYIHGSLEDNGQNVTWLGESYDVDRIHYEDRPWEKEAHEWAHELRSAYLSGARELKKDQTSLEELM